MAASARMLRFLCLIPLIPLPGCGSSSQSGTSNTSWTAAVSGSSLNGNWNIVGSGILGTATTFPSLAFSLVANGNQLFATGQMLVSCGSSGGGGGTIELRGQIAADGSFELTQPASSYVIVDGSYINVVVNGSVPAAGATGWSGTYSMSSATGSTGCIAAYSNSFLAVPFSPFTGTYAGKLIEAGSSGSAPFSFVVAQGGPAAFTTGLGTQYVLSVGGTVSVTGIPCFTQGSILSSAPSQVWANNVLMYFTMNDGSELLLTGQLSSTQATTLNLVTVGIQGGQCNGFYVGSLVRQ